MSVPLAWKTKLLALLQQSAYAAFLDSGSTIDRAGRYSFLAAGGASAITAWDELVQAQPGWRMVLLPYELRHRLFPNQSTSASQAVVWPEVVAFEPSWLVYQLHGQQDITLLSQHPAQWWAALDAAAPLADQQPTPLAFTPDLSDADFEQHVEAIRQHIRHGDVYQVNLSRQFQATGLPMAGEALFARQLAQLDVPQGAFFRMGQQWLVSGSMERFLARRDSTLISQPIKGTRPRHSDPSQDQAAAAELAASTKERAENVMIVDMVRNDLNRSCIPGSVAVPELFGVHNYPHVHQLVSTVTGTLRPEVSNWQAIAHAFPPASMTGAPKEAALHTIQRYEASSRGAYAGAVGWMDPSGDFDLSVLIRTIFADEATCTTSYRVGGGITYGSDPATELAETEWKARGIRRLLGLA